MGHWRPILFALLPGWLSIPAAAQTFNVRSDPHGLMLQEVAFSCTQNAQGQYIVIAGAPFYDSAYYYSSVVTSLLLDQSGTVLQVDRVIHPEHATYPGGPNNVTRLPTGGYVTGGSNFRTDSADNWIQRPVLYFFNGTGLVEDFVELGPEDSSWIGRQAKPTPDGGYVICGDAGGDPFVIKTDDQGQELWIRRFGGPYSDFALSISNGSGGGYYFGGSARVAPNNLDHWVVALNDTGGVVWDKKWGTIFDDSNVSLITLDNGNVLLASRRIYAANGSGRQYLVELDRADGTILWQHEYGPECPSCGTHSVKEIMAGGDLIAAGTIRLPTTSHNGTLLRTTAQGDSLWMRTYHYHDADINNGRGLFWDVTPTTDGGFLACGGAFGELAADTLLYSQDIWVVKVDEHGCLEPGCHLITGMETQITNLRDALKVWPNPASSGTPVQVEMQLPEGFVVQGQLRLTVTDAARRVVQEEVLGQNGHHERSDTNLIALSAPFASGLYHLHLHDATRWISGTKLVVQQ